MSTARRLARDTLVLTLGNFAGLGIGLVGTVIVARTLGPEGRGLYAWLVTFSSIGVQIASLAPPHAVRFLAGQGHARLPGTLAAFCILGTIPTLPLAAYAALDPDFGQALGPLVALAWLAVPLTAAAVALMTLVQVEARPGAILLVQTAPRLIQVIAVLGLAAAGALDLSAAILLYTFTAAVTLALVLMMLRPSPADLRPDPDLMRRLGRQLGLVWIAALALFCTPRISLLLLPAAAPVEALGQYSVALALQETAMALPVAIGGVLVTEAGRRGLPPPSRRLATAALVLAPVALACAAAALLSPLLVPLVFGQAFAPAAGQFQPLLGSVVLAGLYWLAQPILIDRGRARDLALPALAGFAVAALVAVTAIPAFSSTGAVLSNLAGFAVLATLAALLAARAPAGVRAS